MPSDLFWHVQEPAAAGLGGKFSNPDDKDAFN